MNLIVIVVLIAFIWGTVWLAGLIQSAMNLSPWIAFPMAILAAVSVLYLLQKCGQLLDAKAHRNRGTGAGEG